jgi:hypothetical protein
MRLRLSGELPPQVAQDMRRKSDQWGGGSPDSMRFVDDPLSRCSKAAVLLAENLVALFSHLLFLSFTRPTDWSSRTTAGLEAILPPIEEKQLAESVTDRD